MTMVMMMMMMMVMMMMMMMMMMMKDGGDSVVDYKNISYQEEEEVDAWVYYDYGDCAATTAAVVDADDGVFCDDDNVDCDHELNFVGHP